MGKSGGLMPYRFQKLKRLINLLVLALPFTALLFFFQNCTNGFNSNGKFQALAASSATGCKSGYSLVNSSCYANQIYVALNGNDSATGDINSPLQTIAGAQTRVQAIKNANPGSALNLSVTLRGGAYYLSKPLQFAAADSGWPNAPIVYSSYTGEHAVLSGGSPVLNWSQSPDGMYYASIPGIQARQIYTSAPLNEQPSQVLFPSAGTYFSVTGYNFSGSCAGTANPSGTGALLSLNLNIPAMYANANIADALIGSELVILKTFTESRLIVANVTVTGPTQ
jgi:hypothetical protein